MEGSIQNPEVHEVEQEYRKNIAVTTAVPVVKKVALLVWAAVDVVLVAVFLFVVVGYLVYGSFMDAREVASIVDNTDNIHASTALIAASSIKIGETEVFSLGDDYYDIFAQLENPNSKWYATFDYFFSYDGIESERLAGYIMPGETKPLAVLRQGLAANPRDAEFVVDEFSWERVDAHEVENIDEWMAVRDNFIVSDASHGMIEIDGKEIPRTTFKLENRSPFSYWSPTFLVLIENNGNIQGINTVTVAGFETGEEREISVNWFGNAPSYGDVAVIPSINYFDPDAYMPLPGESLSDIRDTLEVD